LGLAYKPNVDDLRESPAMEVVQLLQEEGVQVKVWEPFKPDADIRGIDMACTLDEAIHEAAALLLLVRHTQFLDLIPEELISKTQARIAIDTVNGWDAQQWQKAGFQFVRLGTGKE
jgi:UDP-N-acetyl-D-mannosaminuronate dehydrogenase